MRWLMAFWLSENLARDATTTISFLLATPKKYCNANPHEGLNIFFLCLFASSHWLAC